MPHLPLRWLYYDLNSYFASVEQQIEPRLRGKPVAVVPVMSDATCAIAASYEAKAFGIKTGTPIWEAKKICKEIICVPARHDVYVDYHHQILKEVESHIHIDIVASIDEVACRLMNNENSPEKALSIARNIKAGVTKNVGECLRSSIGIAPNKYLAKVATELQKPDGLVILRSEDIPAKFMHLKLRDLPGIGHNMEQRLRLHGIGDIKTLMNFSPKQMRKIWHSVWGEKMYYMLRGIEIPDVETSRSTIGHSHVMAPEFRDPAKAIIIARRLMVKAASRLRRLGFVAESLTFSARLENGGRWAAEARFVKSEDNMTFLNALNQMWAAMVEDIGQERLKKVSVTLYRLTAAKDIQPELFDILDEGETMKRRKAERLSVAMDSINHKYGRDTLVIGALPEQARSISGSKIAFTRIPDIEEFLE